MSIGTAFLWTVILGIIASLFITNSMDEIGIVFATCSGLMFFYTLYLILEST